MHRIFIRAKIKKNRTTEKTTFEYPKMWQSDKIHVVAYEDHPEVMGECEECCIGVVSPEFWEIMKDDPDIEQINVKDANIDCCKWKPQTTKILNQDAVIMALATPEKNRTEKEKNILDPKHKEVGINEASEFDIRRFVAPGQIEEELTTEDLSVEI